jgi:hypothetical protein
MMNTGKILIGIALIMMSAGLLGNPSTAMQIPASIEDPNWIFYSIDDIPVKEIPPIPDNEEFFRQVPTLHSRTV